MTPLEQWAQTEGSADLAEIYTRFGVEAFRRTAAHNAFDRCVDTLGFKGRHCYEIGSFRGMTAVVLSRYFERVTSIDIINDPMKYEVVNHLGITNITFVRGLSANLVLPEDCDAAYVDGNHVNIEEDFETVRGCGKVLFHEYWPTNTPVWEFINGLRKSGEEISVFRNFALWTGK